MVCSGCSRRTSEQDLSAIHWAIPHFRPIDLKYMKLILQLKLFTSSKFAHMRLELEEYDKVSKRKRQFRRRCRVQDNNIGTQKPTNLSLESHVTTRQQSKQKISCVG